MAAFDWDDLRYFAEVARQGTLSGAARTLGCDHVTVSRRIAALEAALQSSLFQRGPSGYRLTNSGLALLPHAEQVESAALHATEALNRPQAGLSGKVRLVTPEGFGNYFLNHLLGDFASAFPRLTVEFVTVPQILSLSQREGDVTITLAPPTRGRFRTEKLSDYSLHIYGEASYLSGGKPIESRQDLRHHRFVGYVDDLIFTRELDYLHEVSPGLRASLQNTSLMAQALLTAAGQGLCILPDFVARQHSSLQPVLGDEIELERTYWLNSHEEVAEMPRVRALSKFVRQCVEAHGAFQ